MVLVPRPNGWIPNEMGNRRRIWMDSVKEEMHRSYLGRLNKVFQDFSKFVYSESVFENKQIVSAEENIRINF